MIPKIIVKGEQVSIELDFANKSEAIYWLLDGNNINDLVEGINAETEEKE